MKKYQTPLRGPDIKYQSGFTLVEVLVVIAILSIIGLIAVTIFTRTLKGVNKSQIISSLKQNGQSVLENMDKTIRNSDHLVCPTTPVATSTLIVEKDGVYTRFRFVPPRSPDDQRSQCMNPLDTDRSKGTNGCILQDNPLLPAAEIPAHFISVKCDPTDPMEEYVLITDTDPQSGVSIYSGSFILNRKAGFKDSMNVKFSLMPGLEAPAVVAGQIDPVSFETTVQLR